MALGHTSVRSNTTFGDDWLEAGQSCSSNELIRLLAEKVARNTTFIQLPGVFLEGLLRFTVEIEEVQAFLGFESMNGGLARQFDVAILLEDALALSNAVLRDAIGVWSVLSNVEGEHAFLVSLSFQLPVDGHVTKEHARDLLLSLHVALDEPPEGQVGAGDFLEVRQTVLNALLGGIDLFLSLRDDLDYILMKRLSKIICLGDISCFRQIVRHFSTLAPFLLC